MPDTSLTDAQKWILGGVAAVAVLLGLALVLTASMRDDDPAAVSTTTTTTAATTTSTSASSTTTTEFEPEVDEYAVAFPSPRDSRRFDQPTPAAEAFATEVLGFVAVVTGDPRFQTESWVEFDIRWRDGGPVTVLELRRLEDRTWYVIEARTPDIEVRTPVAGASLSTPFETSGSALAFEGTVDVTVLSQSGLSELGRGTVTGSGSPPPGPFSGRIFYSPPPEAAAGILVYRARSEEDGQVIQATAFPIRVTTGSG